MKLLDQLHGGYVHPRRVRLLCRLLCPLLPPGAQVLDVGSGDGWLARLMMDERPDLNIRGIDVSVRRDAHIPVEKYDGLVIPYPNRSFDALMLVDVLHHTTDGMVLLREARRVSRQGIVIKDHLCEGNFGLIILKIMDWVGNKRHGVQLPNNYWSRRQWVGAFEELGLTVVTWSNDLRLYPPMADWLFGGSRQFISRLDVGMNEKS